MEVTGPAPIGGGQPLQPIQPPETVTPASDVAPADAVDRVEFSPEAQARVEAGVPVSGAGAVGEVAPTGTALPPLAVDPAHANWLAEQSPAESSAILEGQRRFWVSQGYGAEEVTAHLDAYQETLDQLRATG
ncbi:MAG: hypothetical protein VYA32_11120 [Planctomycetota bacterium]|nr:hypothetical protein [Planctomycetota bacterium]MED5449023.1 hypothetical protein [Planctomycetota bacterium]MEE3366662.1 hypothetical protein [Planctomycetota bacterium]